MKKKVVGIDDSEYIWKVSGDVVNSVESRKTSELHKQARKIIYELFPTTMILEEVPVKLTAKGNTVYFDYYLPQIDMAIEVHGKQHYFFSTLFHADRQAFIKQQKTDRDKATFCELNRITFIELPYNEEIEQWTQKIQSKK